MHVQECSAPSTTDEKSDWLDVTTVLIFHLWCYEMCDDKCLQMLHFIRQPIYQNTVRPQHFIQECHRLCISVSTYISKPRKRRKKNTCQIHYFIYLSCLEHNTQRFCIVRWRRYDKTTMLINLFRFARIIHSIQRIGQPVGNSISNKWPLKIV